MMELMPYQKRKKHKISLCFSLSLSPLSHNERMEGEVGKLSCKPRRELSYLMNKIYLFLTVGAWDSECLDVNPSPDT